MHQNQFAKQIFNITVQKPPQKQATQKHLKQGGVKNHFVHHQQQRIHTEPSPKNSESEKYESFQSFLEINQIEETDEDENLNFNINSQDLQQKLSVSFYAKQERRSSQFEVPESNNLIYQPLMCKQRKLCHHPLQQFAANQNQEFYLLNNASTQLYKASSSKTCNSKHQQLSNQLTSAATSTLGKSSLKNTSVSKVDNKHSEKNEQSKLLNQKMTNKNKLSIKAKPRKKDIKQPEQRKTARISNLASYLSKFTQTIKEVSKPNISDAKIKFQYQQQVNSSPKQTKQKFNKQFIYLRTPKYHFYGRAEEADAFNKDQQKVSWVKF